MCPPQAVSAVKSASKETNAVRGKHAMIFFMLQLHKSLP
jgi:hypothetical protein